MAPWISFLVISLVISAIGGDCSEEAAACQDVGAAGSSTASLLMKGSRVGKSLTAAREFSEEFCAPLVLPGFRLEGCDGLSPGTSCKVSCPQGLVGEPVRYFCFSDMAASGAQPAALAPPLCHNSSKAEYSSDQVLPLAWKGAGCLHCPGNRKICSTVTDAVPGDERCTLFKLDMESSRIRWNDDERRCLYTAKGPSLGIWSCRSNADFWFYTAASQHWPGAKALCGSSSRGAVCLDTVRKNRFFNEPVDGALLQPLLAAMGSGDNKTFLRKAYAMQVCRARLESALPDSFWDWLQTQDIHLMQALFATFPVHPGQLRRFYDIRELVGHEKFDALGMASFAVALSYVNRFKNSMDEAVQFLKPNWEYNGATWIEGEEDRMRQEMIDGEHCHLQSNECRDLHKCCGAYQNWSFPWPRDPSPTVRDWVEWWLKEIEEHPDKLWMNPLQEVPWVFAVYLWPSPLKECDWVHSKLIDEEPMEGRWYYYYSSFHLNVCEGGDYHPDSLPGIAVYGGVCGRMSQLAWRKAGCMGMPATQKSEPGHSAGFQLEKRSARYSSFNVITDVSNLTYLEVVPQEWPWVYIELAKGEEAFPHASTTCLSCRSWRRCTTAAAGSGDCTPFKIDKENARIVAKHNANQCLTLRSGPRADLTRCWWGSVGTSQDISVNQANETVIAFGSRGTLRFRFSNVPQQKQEGCLVCAAHRQACTFALSNSSTCSKFDYDQDRSVIRIVGIDKCLDIYSGPKPGVWTCNGGGNQRATVTEAGDLLVASGRGHYRFARYPVAEDFSEHGRCLVCPLTYYGQCRFAAAGSAECSEFAFEEEKQLMTLVGATRRRCLNICPGPHPCVASCSGHEHQKVSHDPAEGRLKFESSRGKMFLHVPHGGEMPPVTTRWSQKGIHGIKCTKSNCHFTSVMGLDSNEMFYRRHKEAILAAVEGWNNYETHGLYPTAHDEARLAATMVYALKRDAVVSDDDLMPVLTWALKRNPTLFDAWELAAEFPLNATREGVPSREALPSHEWFQTLDLLGVKATSSRGSKTVADSFAREHLVDKPHWAQLPQLQRSLVDHLCGSLSNGMLEELSEASFQCRLLHVLEDGSGWSEAQDEMLDEDALGERNAPSEKFMMYWETMVRLALWPEIKSGSLPQLVESLLKHLTVGYVNERSQTFFAEHGRVLLRSPYAHMLQLAAVVLDADTREEILASTMARLEHPTEAPDRLWASTPALKWSFLEWSALPRQNGSSAVFEESSAADVVNGFAPEDEASPEVMEELLKDVDQRLELGSAIFPPAQADAEDGERGSYTGEALLRSLLRLDASSEVHVLDDEEEEEQQQQGGEGEEEGEQRGEEEEETLLSATARRARASATGGGMTPSELLQSCMDDLLAGA